MLLLRNALAIARVHVILLVILRISRVGIITVIIGGRYLHSHKHSWLGSAPLPPSSSSAPSAEKLHLGQYFDHLEELPLGASLRYVLPPLARE